MMQCLKWMAGTLAEAVQRHACVTLLLAYTHSLATL